MRPLPKMQRPNMFIGTGPGRCGTASLAAILDALPGVVCHHENHFSTPQGTIDVQRILSLFYAHPTHLTGEVSLLFVAFVPFVRMQFPGMPVVCLHRPKDEVVESFNKRIIRANKAWIMNPLGRFEEMTPEIAAQHWEWAELQMSRYTEPVFHMRTKDLNDDNALHALCDFLEIPEDNRTFRADRVFNKGDEGMHEFSSYWTERAAPPQRVQYGEGVA